MLKKYLIFQTLRKISVVLIMKILLKMPTDINCLFELFHNYGFYFAHIFLFLKMLYQDFKTKRLEKFLIFCEIFLGNSSTK